jgi:hypothetical protein
MQFSWLWVDRPARVYAVITAVNLVAGAAAAGVSVSLSTLVYKVTPSAGRAVQLAVYSIAVTLFAAPLPTIGGHVPDWLCGLGLPRDLRFTFYAAGVFMLASSAVARRIADPRSFRTRHMLRDFGGRLCPPAMRWWAAGAAAGQEASGRAP